MRREETVLQLKGEEEEGEKVNAGVDSVGRRNKRDKYICKGIKDEVCNICKANWVQFKCGRVFHPTSNLVVN